MSQLGLGLNSGFPSVIDTRQHFQNVPNPAPDSDTRLDCEVINDVLSATINIEETLGTNPQGGFASVAARLNFYLPDAPPGTTNIVDFVNAVSVSVLGSNHGLASDALLWRIWDNGSPRATLEPNTFTVAPTSHNVVTTFNVPQSGTLVLDAPPSKHVSTYTNAEAFTITGGTHGLGTADLLWALYNATSPAASIQPNTLTVHPTTFDVIVTFPVGTLNSGSFLLSPGRAAYVAPFTNETVFIVPGVTHGLGTADLLWGLWDANTPRQAIAPGSLTVDAATHDVTLTFNVPQSGRLVLASAQTGALTLTRQRRLQRPILEQTDLLLLTVQRLQARIVALEASHLAMLAHLTAPPTPQEVTP